MKTFITFLISLTALITGAVITGKHAPDVAVIVAALFTAGLTAWTAQQYQRKFPALTRSRPLRLPIGEIPPEKTPVSHRLAA